MLYCLPKMAQPVNDGSQIQTFILGLLVQLPV